MATRVHFLKAVIDFSPDPSQVKSVNSSNSCACANHSWDKAADDIELSLVNIPVTTPENLYLMGE